MPKLVDKTMMTAVIEVTLGELNEKGFDRIWDEIREHYPKKDYTIDNVKTCTNGKIYLITLRSINHLSLLEN